MQTRQSSMLLFRLVLAVSLLALPGPVLSAAESVGTVVAVRGTVQAISATGEARRLTLKAPVYAEDSIATDSKGRIQLLFSDNTIISLGRNARMKIAEYRWSDAAGQDAAMKTKVSEGAFRVLGGAISKTAPKNFTTETPAATIGIRGSSYAGRVTPDQQLAVVLLGGKGIDVFNAAGRTPITKPGFGTFASPGVPPKTSFRFSAEDLKGLDGSLSADGLPDQTPDSDEDRQEDDGQAGTSDDEANDSEQTAAPAETTDDATAPDRSDAAQDAPPADAEPAPSPAGTTETSGTTTLMTTATQEVTQNSTESQFIEDLSGATGTTITSLTDLATSTDVYTAVVIALTDTSINALLDSLAYPASYRYRATVPTNGIESFSGRIKGTHTELDGTSGLIDDPARTKVNWYNRKFIGVIEDNTGSPGDPAKAVFFFGTVNADGTIGATRIIGPDHQWDDSLMGYFPSIIAGSATSGEFLGPQSDLAFGFKASGTNITIRTLTSGGAWDITGAAVSQGIKPGDGTAPTGNAVWEGFMVGLAEDVTDPGTNRRLFMNDDSLDFSLAINRDSGTLSSTIRATDALGSGTFIDSINTAAAGSAYVDDGTMIAILGCGGCIGKSGYTSQDLKNNFNYLVSGDPETRIATYAEWGVWEAAYLDPVSLATYHIHMPGSWWVAGAPTSPGDRPTTGTATYTGVALGTHVTGSGLTKLTGTTSMTVDFANLPTTGSIVGSINFPGELNLTFSSMAGNVASSGNFNISNVGGANVSSGKVGGAFFGPAAESVAGNFLANMNDSTKYIGIFGGDR